MVRNDLAEVIRKKLCKWYLPAGRSIVEFDAEGSNAGMLQIKFFPLDSAFSIAI